MPLRPGAEVGVGVVNHRGAVRGPAGVGNASACFQAIGLHLRQQVGHTRGAARALQARLWPRCAPAGGMNGHAARVIATVFQALQALHEDGNDVARRHCADDAAHKAIFLKKKRKPGRKPCSKVRHARRGEKKLLINFCHENEISFQSAHQKK